MFSIGATQKVLKSLDIKPSPYEEGMEVERWHLNSFKIGRYTCLTLIHDRTLYSVTIVGVKKKDLQNLQELLIGHLRETLLADEFDPEVVDVYLKKGKEMIITPTNNRTTLGYLTEMILGMKYVYPLGKDIESVDVNEINSYNNRIPHYKRKGYAIDFMKEYLERE